MSNTPGQIGRKPIKAKRPGLIDPGRGRIRTGGKSLHEHWGIRPDMRMPTVVVASLHASDLKRVTVHDKRLSEEIRSWLRRLALHPRVNSFAMREISPTGVPHLHCGRLSAISQFPWWQIESVKLGPDGLPMRDYEHVGPDERFHSILIYPPIPPPSDLVRVLDQAADGALTNRTDGGPTPESPRGTGSHLPTKRGIQ